MLQNHQILTETAAHEERKLTYSNRRLLRQLVNFSKSIKKTRKRDKTPQDHIQRIAGDVFDLATRDIIANVLPEMIEKQVKKQIMEVLDERIMEIASRNPLETENDIKAIVAKISNEIND